MPQIRMVVAQWAVWWRLVHLKSTFVSETGYACLDIVR